MLNTVFVSGATGYIAQYVVIYLLEKGYEVIGSVRSKEKGERLAGQLENKSFKYVLIPDIGAKGAFDGVLTTHPEITIFIHTASPFHYSTNEIEKDLMLPAIHGTQNALLAVKTLGSNIKRFVLTSSYVSNCSFLDDNSSNVTVDETSWNQITWEESLENAFNGYYGSKKFAEQAAWDFMKKEDPPFSLTCVNPSLVLGPQAFDLYAKGTVNTSAEMVNEILKLNVDSPIPKIKGPCIDVRDVAKAHLAAFENENTKNQRLIISYERFTSQGILDIVRETLPDLRSSLPIGTPGGQIEASRNTCIIDNSRTKTLLGYNFIPLKKTVTESIEQAIRANTYT